MDAIKEVHVCFKKAAMDLPKPYTTLHVSESVMRAWAILKQGHSEADADYIVALLNNEFLVAYACL